jgi:hypothetical protein
MRRANPRRRRPRKPAPDAGTGHGAAADNAARGHADRESTVTRSFVAIMSRACCTSRASIARSRDAARLGAHLVLVDESAFMSIPTVRRNWAPVGETPIIHPRYNHARNLLIGGLTVSPKRRRLRFNFGLQRRISRAMKCTTSSGICCSFFVVTSS